MGLRPRLKAELLLLVLSALWGPSLVGADAAGATLIVSGMATSELRPASRRAEG